MIGGAKRQLPSWMVKPAATYQTSKPEAKEEDKENDIKELDTKARGPHKKVQRKPRDSSDPLPENTAHLHENCKEKRKLTLQDEEGQSNKAGKKFPQGDERRVLKKCETSRRGKNKRISNKRCDDEGDGNDTEMKVDAEVREKHGGIVPRRKKQKGEVIMDGSALSDGVVMDPIQSDDELTVDDLISIAEEYVNTERDKELLKTQGGGYGSEVRPLVTSTSETGLETDLDARECEITANDEELSATVSSTEPSTCSGSVLNLGGTVDPVQKMLELFLGPFFKTAEASETKSDDMISKY